MHRSRLSTVAKPVKMRPHPMDVERAPLADLTFDSVTRFLILHLPLLVVFRFVPFLATAHSLLVLLLGFHFLVRDKDPLRVIYVLAYISGAEILWRGVEASPVWEYGKYATLLLAVLMILKYSLFRRGMLVPVIFVALLVPGILIMPAFDRQAISYELAGPVTLAVLSLAFNHFEFKKTELQRVFVAMLAPTVAMAALVIFMLITNDVEFYARTENELITGQIGANQVSSTLSWGALAAFFYVFIYGKDQRLRNMMLAGFIGLLAISVLTFSRAGLWNALGAVAVSLFFMVRDRQQLARIFGVLLVVALVTAFVLYPLLVNLTGGTVLARFSDFDSTGRDRLVQSDYETFVAYPLFGVGVGQARYYRPYLSDQMKNSHTEYTRLLAEHGILGVGVILILIGMTMERAFASRGPMGKGISVGFSVWALLYLAHSATRTVSPSFAFGFAAARFAEDDLKEPVDEPKPAHPHRLRR